MVVEKKRKKFRLKRLLILGMCNMNEQHKPSCYDCKYNNFDGGCVAFPEDIPFRFTAGSPHLEPTPEQGNDIVFE
jgi:hypothetical protein